MKRGGNRAGREDYRGSICDFVSIDSPFVGTTLVEDQAPHVYTHSPHWLTYEMEGGSSKLQHQIWIWDRLNQRKSAAALLLDLMVDTWKEDLCLSTLSEEHTQETPSAVQPLYQCTHTLEDTSEEALKLRRLQ
ncbi:hypothetical protein RvY_01008-1 [Ramazzottius varieornatus]|uniref:Uncharacterized protein n=1 Tax=Ramazzottius varieornatus TaxID=947166 RepID=A0A1D1UES9_RAMVA|nr:hypothetical protein RvY_01008-1 [Ramazzottius varieornatus]